MSALKLGAAAAAALAGSAFLYYELAPSAEPATAATNPLKAASDKSGGVVETIADALSELGLGDLDGRHNDAWIKHHNFELSVQTRLRWGAEYVAKHPLSGPMTTAQVLALFTDDVLADAPEYDANATVEENGDAFEKWVRERGLSMAQPIAARSQAAELAQKQTEDERERRRLLVKGAEEAQRAHHSDYGLEQYERDYHIDSSDLERFGGLNNDVWRNELKQFKAELDRRDAPPPVDTYASSVAHIKGLYTAAMGKYGFTTPTFSKTPFADRDYVSTVVTSYERGAWDEQKCRRKFETWASSMDSELKQHISRNRSKWITLERGAGGYDWESVVRSDSWMTVKPYGAGSGKAWLNRGDMTKLCDYITSSSFSLYRMALQAKKNGGPFFSSKLADSS